MNEVTNNWTNVQASIDKVESSVIAYFSLNDEDFMIAFQRVSVNIISQSNLLYWMNMKNYLTNQ